MPTTKTDHPAVAADPIDPALLRRYTLYQTGGGEQRIYPGDKSRPLEIIRTRGPVLWARDPETLAVGQETRGQDRFLRLVVLRREADAVL